MDDSGIGQEAALDHPPVCLFTGATPHGPECGEPATVHVAAFKPGGILAGLAACDQHADTARSVPSYVDEHPHRGWCGFPGSIWDENGKRCVLDDRGQSRAARTDRAAVPW